MSRDQDVVLKVISYFDMAVVGFVLALIGFGLLFAGRPQLVRWLPFPKVAAHFISSRLGIGVKQRSIGLFKRGGMICFAGLSAGVNSTGRSLLLRGRQVLLPKLERLQSGVRIFTPLWQSIALMRSRFNALFQALWSLATQPITRSLARQKFEVPAFSTKSIIPKVDSVSGRKLLHVWCSAFDRDWYHWKWAIAYGGSRNTTDRGAANAACLASYARAGGCRRSADDTAGRRSADDTADGTDRLASSHTYCGRIQNNPGYYRRVAHKE
jgi:hypothetical protein